MKLALYSLRTVRKQTKICCVHLFLKNCGLFRGGRKKEEEGIGLNISTVEKPLSQILYIKLYNYSIKKTALPL